MHYDLIIIGAGIAGIATAIHTKKQKPEINILIIDKKAFPRNKLCAGYLTSKSVKLLKELDLEVNKIDYKLVKGIRIFFKKKIKIHAKNHGLYYQNLVDRTVLDFELFKLLKNYNITVKENVKIQTVNEKESLIVINEETYHYQNLVFADGELGYSAKYNPNAKKYIALQMNFPKEKTANINMYFGIVKKGYAWYATSGTHANIGFCDIYNKNIDYYKLFGDFVKELDLDDELKKNKVKGFFVPYGLKKVNLINNNIYLSGDAAGTVDPLTLAGISYAILSGKYIAKSIIMNNPKIYLKYLHKIRKKFMILKIMAKILYNPIFMFFFIRISAGLFGRQFAFILDKFVLGKKASFHE